MATDGTKIIDGDLAHDIDGEFMDLYDAGKSIGEIKTKIETWRSELMDDVEKEIFITTYALDLWKIGALTEDILNEVKETIAKGAGVKMWKEESGEKDANARSRELEKFITQISTPKEKPQARRKLKETKDYIYQIDDVITFKANDGFYYAAILVDIFQHKGSVTYCFTPTTYKSTEKPTIDDILKSQVIGKRVKPSGIGVEKYATGHRELGGYKKLKQFELIGQIHIPKEHKVMSLYGGTRGFDDFAERFISQEKHLAMPVWQAEKIPVSEAMQSQKSIWKGIWGLFK